MNLTNQKNKFKSILFQCAFLAIALSFASASNAHALLNSALSSSSISSSTSANTSLAQSVALFQTLANSSQTLTCSAGLDSYPSASSSFGCVARNKVKIKDVALVILNVVGRAVTYKFMCKEGMPASVCNSQAFLFYNSAADYSQVSKTAYTNEDNPNWNTTGVTSTLVTDYAN